jgi:hypothetical protein
VVGTFMANVLLNLPYTLDFSNGYAMNCVLITPTFVAIAGGFFTSYGGKPLWKDELFD